MVAVFSSAPLDLLKATYCSSLQNSRPSWYSKIPSSHWSSHSGACIDFPNFEFIISAFAQQLRNHQTTNPNRNAEGRCSSEKARMSLKKLADFILVTAVNWPDIFQIEINTKLT
ncbi:hypothetical protein VP01_370g3 [Puccinia sorghi]|uniref:Uncharacterized protein n=1 Tax=Puccinia sorghi TaxID=27349 RepID=A0A0L6UU82_9BASI|nr:hypothetical protein VP01_370g3 [Puccinia sorghi]